MATIILQGLLHLENKVQKQSLGWSLFKRYKHVALDHKASHKDHIFFLLRCIHYLKAEYIRFPLMYGLLGSDIWNLKIWNLRVKKKYIYIYCTNHLYSYQIKFLAMHITKPKIGYIYSRKCTKYLHGTWSLLNILMIFDIKINHFDPYNVLLAIATNIAMWLMTGFVVQGHILTF